MTKLTFYSTLLFSVLLFFSGFFFKSNNKIKQNIIVSNKIKKDTSINKLPEGYPYITNFTFSKLKHIKAICTDSLGITVFADNSGITFFDGETEENISIEDSPNLIKKDITNNIFYAACKKGYGIIKKNKNGEFSYFSLSDKHYESNAYDNIIVNKNEVIFSGKHKIVSYDIKTKKIKTLFTDKKRTVTGIFKLNEKLFVNFKNEGLKHLSGNTFTNVTSDSIFSENSILFSFPYKNNIITGMSNNEIYLFDGTNYSPFETDSKEYIKESIINGGGDFDKTGFIVTTLNGGCVILNKQNGKTISTLNYRTGLPDDEIFAYNRDRDGGLWLAHEYGASRAAFDIPVKNFNNYPGLQGNINAVKFFDSTLYVATGEGLFKLSEIKSYEEVKIAENKKIKYVRKIRTGQINNSYLSDKVKESINEYNNIENNIEEESNFFKRWKKRREKKKKEKEAEEETDTQTEDNTTKQKSGKRKKTSRKYSYKTEYKTITEYKKIYELHSTKFTYKKIKGINNKCKALTEYRNGLLISTNSGLFFIDKQDSMPVTVIPEAYIYDTGCRADKNVFYAGTSKGLFKITKSDNDFKIRKIEGSRLKEVTLKSIYTVNDSTLWATSSQKVFLFKISGARVISTEEFNMNTNFDEDIIITKENNKFIFLTDTKAWKYDPKYKHISEDPELTFLLNEADKIYLLNDSSFTVNKGSEILYTSNPQNVKLKYAWIFNNIKKINIDRQKNIWVITGENGIFQITNDTLLHKEPFKIFLTGIKDFRGRFFKNRSYLELNSNYKSITVRLSSPGYLKKGFVNYFYGIDVADKSEFIKTRNPYFSIPELTPGKHVLSVYAVNALNEKSNTLKIIIEVKPPLWQTSWFIVAVFTVFLISISSGISAFYRNKQRKIKEYNEILEAKVQERTSEIQAQNELIQKQNAEIYEQYKKIDFQNKEITGSIRYAGKIQRAALSDTGIYTKYVSGFFILFKPRDIVSGDFYWINEAKNKLLIAAVDCTGHGVPGGFLSMLGISFLNEIINDTVKKDKEIKAADILTTLRAKIITTLTSHGENERKDGMDMSLVIIDKEKMMLNFAGANNPAYIIRNEKLAKIEADRMPVGYNKKLNDIPFKNKYVPLKKNDLIYLFSDGYADQFGGSKGKKFNSKRFREMLLYISKFPMTEQEMLAEKILKKWMGNYEQIDDILLIGIKI
ncbi:MAG: SpoIIE family protein phosphatase [Chlorobi bacterium]|nr:SpoIIE family protein phosphatase [Chlorobiota bacterium]